MTNERKLKGVVVPSITPFRPDGEIDEAALHPYLDFLADNVHAVSVCAIYGAGIMMRPEQRKRVAEIAVQAAGGRALVSVFVGAADTDTSVELARHAQQAGAQALSCVAPFYYRQVDEAIFRHYQAVIQSVDLPVYAYDSPVYAGNQLSLAVIDRLAGVGLAGAITGAASYGIEQLWAIRNRVTRPDFDVWSIRDGLALPAMMLGAVGFESGIGNYFPELVMALYQAIERKDYAQAAVLQDRALQVRDVSHELGRNIPTLHALIRMRGFDTGVPRRPFYPLSDDEVAGLKAALLKLGFETPLQG